MAETVNSAPPIVFLPSEGPTVWRLYEFSGPNAADFLHRLSTVNITAMQPGQGSQGAFLTAQGKFRAYFWLWRIDPDSFFFEFDATESLIFEKELLAFIDQMTFGEKISLKPMDKWTCQWVFTTETMPVGISPLTPNPPYGFRVNHGSKTFGKNWTSVWGPEAMVNQHVNTRASIIDWGILTTWRTEALQPWPGSEITNETMPPEVGIPEAVARGKGCYPGQEVMEKIFSMGAAPRRLCRVQADKGKPMLRILRKGDAQDGKIIEVNGQKVTVLACAPSSLD